MEKVLIVFLSATSASAVKSILEKKYAIASRIVQAPPKISDTGCAYALELKEKNLYIAWNIVKSMDISSKGVYNADASAKIL